MSLDLFTKLKVGFRAFLGPKTSGRIDTHFHVVPDFYNDAVVAAGGDPSSYQVEGGRPTPLWSPESCIEGMEALGITRAYCSVTAPGPMVKPLGPEQRVFTRRLNDWVHSELVAKHPSRYGFFASLPSFHDVDGVLEEIDYSMITLKADGFIVFTSYVDASGASCYLGHPAFDRILAKLDSLAAVVFIHPCKAPSPRCNPLLFAASIDYPHETTRTAADLVVSLQKHKYPHMMMILSHGGGTLPGLALRIAGGAEISGCKRSRDNLLADFKTFYCDVALSAAPAALDALLQFADHDRILYGSDFPYGPKDTVRLLNALLEVHIGSKGGNLMDRINHLNAEALFKRSKVQWG